MLNDARNYISQAWWTVLLPGIAISLIVILANVMGDSLRDCLDPALRGVGFFGSAGVLRLGGTALA